MALESGTFISDLVVTNPAATDQVSRGDDHLRLIKDVLRNTFPNAGRAIYFARGEEIDTGRTINLTDNALFLKIADAVDRVVTLPEGLGVGNSGFFFVLMKGVSVGIVTIDPGVEVINNDLSSYVLRSDYQWAIVCWIGTRWVVLSMDPTVQAADITDSSETGRSLLTGTVVQGRTALGLGGLSIQDTVNNGDWSGADLTIGNGGTGASTVEGARDNLGLGVLATKDFADLVYNGAAPLQLLYPIGTTLLIDYDGATDPENNQVIDVTPLAAGKFEWSSSNPLVGTWRARGRSNISGTGEGLFLVQRTA